MKRPVNVPPLVARDVRVNFRRADARLAGAMQHAHAKRIAGRPRSSRSVRSAGVFTAAFLRHEAESPGNSPVFPGGEMLPPKFPLALFIRWQTLILGFGCGFARYVLVGHPQPSASS